MVRGKPHLRVENRVLPAGPTVADIMANGAFYYGIVRALAEDDRPLWSRMSFAAAEENFHTCARHGLDAEVYWPGAGQVPVTELVLRRLLPLAAEGLDQWEVAPAVRDRLLGIIEQRCLTGRNGAAWQAAHLPPALRLHQPGPARRAAPDDQGVHRAHAQQRAGARLVLSGHRRAAHGSSAIRICVSCPMCAVSLATQSPRAVTSRSLPPTPRSLVGFQASALPVTGSIAPMPGRLTAPGPALSRPCGLSSQRWWPWTYTASSVTATECSVSPPV